MTTSNNQSWELQELAIVNAAYRKLGYLAEDQALGPTPLAIGVEALNGVVSMLTTKGMPLWKRNVSNVVPTATAQVFTVAGAVKIPQVVLTDNVSGSRYPLIEKSRYDFNMLPTGTTGVPVHYAVHTLLPLASGLNVSIWPTLADSNTVASKTINIWYQKAFDGFFSATDTLDFPAYWTQAVIFQLATVLAPEVGLALPDRASIKALAEEYTKMASDYGDEDGSLYIAPDYMSGVYGVY